MASIDASAAAARVRSEKVIICLPLNDFVRYRSTKLANYRQKPIKVNAARLQSTIGPGIAHRCRFERAQMGAQAICPHCFVAKSLKMKRISVAFAPRT
jgi:hypothetical protein